MTLAGKGREGQLASCSGHLAGKMAASRPPWPPAGRHGRQILPWPLVVAKAASKAAKWPQGMVSKVGFRWDFDRSNTQQILLLGIRPVRIPTKTLTCRNTIEILMDSSWIHLGLIDAVRL